MWIITGCSISYNTYDFEESPQIKIPDYSNSNSWAVLPDNLPNEISIFKNDTNDKKADVFFIYPTLIDLHHSNFLKFKRVIKMISIGGIMVSVLIVFFTLIASEFIVDFALGPKYYLSHKYFNAYVFTIIPTYTSFIFSYVFMIEEKTKNLLIIALSGICFNIVLNFALIPVYGIYGAIYSSIASSLLISLLVIFLYQNNYD